MGTFFLIAGTALFLAGLGCLLSVFISTLIRLKAHRLTSIYFRNRSSFKKWTPAVIGVLLVILSQGFYWFHGEVSKFQPFEDTIPQIALAFIVEQDHTPRVELSYSNKNHRISSQLVPLKGRQIFVTSEVILWKKSLKVLGLRDCYHFDGIYYDQADSISVFDRRDPDYELHAGPSRLVSLIRLLGPVFPAETKIMISPAIPIDSEQRHVLRVSPESLSSLEEFDKLQAVDYSP